MNSNPFEIIDPFNKKIKDQSIIVQQFIELIKNKDKKFLLEINIILTNELKKLNNKEYYLKK